MTIPLNPAQDGYPREVAQGLQFEEEISPCSLVIYFEVSDEAMTARLMNRGWSISKQVTGKQAPNHLF